MDTREFVRKMLLRYPAWKDETKEARAVFAGDIQAVAEAAGEDVLQELYDTIAREYDDRGRPYAGFLWRIATRLNPAVGSRRGGRFAFRCLECGTTISKPARCPKCEKLTELTVIMNPRGPIVEIDEDENVAPFAVDGIMDRIIENKKGL